MAISKSRITSIAVMLTVATWALVLGGWWLRGLIILLGVLMSYEYSKMFKSSVVLDTLPLGALWTFAALYPARITEILAGLMILFGITIIRNIGNKHMVLSSLSPVYIGLPILATLHLVETQPLYMVIYMFVITISSDTGGMTFGKFFEGPKLAPKISPGKTWSGFMGGLLLSFIFGTLFMFVVLFENNAHVPVGSLWFWIYASVGLSVASAAGDLIESKLKRIAGVKDSSGLIPGHGGVLDRFDSLLGVVSIFVFLV